MLRQIQVKWSKTAFYSSVMTIVSPRDEYHDHIPAQCLQKSWTQMLEPLARVPFWPSVPRWLYAICQDVFAVISLSRTEDGYALFHLLTSHFPTPCQVSPLMVMTQVWTIYFGCQLIPAGLDLLLSGLWSLSSRNW